MLLEIPVTGAGETPAKAHESDAAFDLYAGPGVSVDLGPGDRALIPTGISLALPEGYAGLILPRSGLAIDEGLTVLNAPGLIDSGYRGEIKVILAHLGVSIREHELADDRGWTHIHKEVWSNIREGDRIAQLLIIRPERALFHFLPKGLFQTHTDRGAAGFGSTGR